MIEIVPFEEAHIVGFRLKGKIDDDSYNTAIAAIDAALANNDTINIYAEVVSIGGMSVDVFFENIKVKFNYMKQLDKFDKEAIVTDKQWLEPPYKSGR